MILKIILLVCMMPIPLILYVVLRNEAKPKKNLILGVTLPKDAREDPRVLAVVRRFLVRETVLLIAIFLLMAPQFLFKSESVVMIWYLTWMIFAIVLPNFPFITANRQLKDLKQVNGWFSESTGLTLVDTKLAVAPKKPWSMWLFLPTIALSLIPIAHTLLTLRGHDEFWPMLVVYGSFALMTAAFFFIYRLVFHQRAEVVDENTTVNAALTQVRRYNWSKSAVVMAWLTCLFTLVVWLANLNTTVIIIASAVYTALLLGFTMRAEFKTRRVQQKLTAESGTSVYTDDDDHWFMGMFYYNPNDSHIMVNKRTGMGTTMNMAKTPAKILMVFVALILLAMPGVGLWMLQEENAPVSLRMTATQITAAHAGTVYTIDVSEIRSAYLLDKLPDKGVRTNGTAMSTVLKGNFRFEGIDNCRLCLDPRTPPFIVIETSERTYIVGSGNQEDTMSVFDQLASLGVTRAATVNK